MFEATETPDSSLPLEALRTLRGFADEMIKLLPAKDPLAVLAGAPAEDVDEETEKRLLQALREADEDPQRITLEDLKRECGLC